MNDENMEYDSEFQESLASLQRYSSAAEELVRNKEPLQNEGFTLLAWAKVPPASPRGKRAHDVLLQRLASAVTARLLKLEDFPVSWLAQNKAQESGARSALAAHVGALSYFAVQLSVRDSQIRKKPAYFLRPDEYSLDKLASHVVSILRCYGVLRSHIEFDSGVEILQDALRSEEEKRRAREEALERRKRVRDGAFWEEGTSTLRLAKRYRSDGCGSAEREAIKAFFFPERETDAAHEEGGAQRGEDVYSDRHGPAAQDPVLEALIEEESSGGALGWARSPLPEVQGITAAPLADLLLRAVESEETTAERAATVFELFGRRGELLDRLVWKAKRSDAARQILLCLADGVGQGRIRMGQRNAPLRRRVLDAAAWLREVSPTPLEAALPSTPPAKRMYFPADGVPEEPAGTPPSLDDLVTLDLAVDAQGAPGGARAQGLGQMSLETPLAAGREDVRTPPGPGVQMALELASGEGAAPRQGFAPRQGPKAKTRPRERERDKCRGVLPLFGFRSVEVAYG